jgi:hypothetical protein
MKKPTVFLCLLTAGSAGVAADNSTGLVPIEDFARAPLYSQVQISPDGRTLAFLREFEGKPVLTFADLTTLKAKGLNAGTVPWRGAPQQVMSFQWIGDRRVVYSASYWDEFFSGVSAVDSDCRNWKPLSGIDATAPSDDGLRALTGAPVIAVRTARRYPLRASTTIYDFDDKDQSILMLDRGEGYGEDVLFPNVVKVYTLTGGYETVVKNPGDVVAWGVDGKRRAAAGVALPLRRRPRFFGRKITDQALPADRGVPGEKHGPGPGQILVRHWFPPSPGDAETAASKPAFGGRRRADRAKEGCDRASRPREQTNLPPVRPIKPGSVR